jgi:hypothetical protein
VQLPLREKSVLMEGVAAGCLNNNSNKRTDEQMNKRTNEQMNKRTDEQMNK